MSFATQWQKAVQNIRGDLSFDDNAEQLRKLLQSRLLTLTDLRDNPEKFFLAHRLLAERAPVLGPGFWIRFTVQYNLFAGTVLAIGDDEQVAQLAEMQAGGLLGCFALTEKLAGVSSGMVVQTTATYDAGKDCFVLDSPTAGAEKNWISQGATADKAVVIADLRVGGKSYGAHGFLMDFRKGGKLVDGIEVGDMGRKTVGNDLDNAWIRFKNVTIPKNALLRQYCDVVDGQYVAKKKGIRPIEMIGQRLFSGRIAVAQAAVTFAQQLVKMTQQYSDNKACWTPGGDAPLSNVPQLRGLYEVAHQRLAGVANFLLAVEAQLNECLRKTAIPSLELVEAIAVGKVKGVETAIDVCFQLKQEVGSYALMGDTGFEQMDFLQCCKFAEGDSRILMQKIARDRMHAFKKKKSISGDPKEVELCGKLAAAMSTRGEGAWDEEWQTVYELAGVVCDRVVGKWAPSARL
mmetsp:Transcript_27891/g.63411  ORF Transcript_27891/g.63411 Transcript_27891/m.63411 type:complete len:461 (+) Transcript_27891:89-1471(+)